MSNQELKKQYSFPIGETLQTEDGLSYKIIGFLGRGGQGEVYRVSGQDGEYAVKWYHADRCLAKIDAKAFHKNLKRNVENGIPKLSSGDTATQFIWPLRMIEAPAPPSPYRFSLGFKLIEAPKMAFKESV